jgi:hypothetical protein
MPGPYTWGEMAKSVGDPTSVDDEMNGKIAVHNADPSAHGQSDESLYNHRIAEILDHLDQSVNNSKIKANSRTYQAIVDINGTGDYTDIQPALDYVNSIGGGSILIMTGTYTISTDLTLYSNITINGQGYSETIIDFNSTSYKLTGIGTFSDPLVNIHITDCTFKNRSSNTYGAINFSYVYDSSIERNYFNNNYDSTHPNSADIFMLNNLCKRVTIRDNITAYSGTFIRGGGQWHTIEHNYSDHSYYSFIDDTGYFYETIVFDNTILWTTLDAIITGANSQSNTIQSNVIHYHQARAIVLGSVFNNVTDNYIDGATYGTYGIYSIDFTANSVITSNRIYRQQNDGVFLGSNCKQNIINNNTIYNVTGYAVNLSTGTSSYNNVDCNNIKGASAGAVNDAGGGNDVSHNVVQ